MSYHKKKSQDAQLGYLRTQQFQPTLMMALNPTLDDKTTILP